MMISGKIGGQPAGRQTGLISMAMGNGPRQGGRQRPDHTRSGRGDAVGVHAAALSGFTGNSPCKRLPSESVISASCRQRGMLLAERQLDTTDAVRSSAFATALVPPRPRMMSSAVFIPKHYEKRKLRASAISILVVDGCKILQHGHAHV